MNYIRHLHAFYQSIKNDESLSALHVTLYLALFQYWNYNRFQNPFPVHRGDLMLLSKIKTKNSYHKCLKELHQKSFIIYHPSNSKFIKAKVSMLKIELKNIDQDFDKSEQFNFSKNFFHGTGIDAVNSNFIPAQYQNKDRNNIKNDTATVSKKILLVKHKHETVNSNSICYKKTAEIIFEKNKKIQEALSSFSPPLEGLGGGPFSSSPGGGREEASLSPIGRVRGRPSLPEAETFFREKNFPPAEAQKFFYYNQSRNWMLNSKTPIKDWKAMAHKWMLIQKEKNIPHSKQINNGKIDSKQSANAAFLRDAKNDFYASAAGSHDDHS